MTCVCASFFSRPIFAVQPQIKRSGFNICVCITIKILQIDTAIAEEKKKKRDWRLLCCVFRYNDNPRIIRSCVFVTACCLLQDSSPTVSLSDSCSVCVPINKQRLAK